MALIAGKTGLDRIKRASLKRPAAAAASKLVQQAPLIGCIDRTAAAP
jgi:hypothetical protein